MGKPIRFTRSSRRHRVGKASAHFVMTNEEAEVGVNGATGETTFTWIGHDERGRELHIVAVDRPDCILVIHVFPTALRGE